MKTQALPRRRRRTDHRVCAATHRVIGFGLVDGSGGTAEGSDPVAERLPISGRLVNVLDPQRLLMRAVQVIEESVVGADAMQGDQT